MIIIALIIVIFVVSATPVGAQDGNYAYQGNGQPPSNSNYSAPGAIQPFQGLSNQIPQNQSQNYASGGPQSYSAPNYYPNNGVPHPYSGQNYSAGGGAQFYQNPNYPLQGSMRINRDPYNAPGQNYQQNYQAPNWSGNIPPQGQNYQNPNWSGNIPPPGQNYQNPNWSGNMPPPGQNYQNPTYAAATPPNLQTGYPMPGGLQPFKSSLLPSQNNIPEAARRQASELINRAYDLSHAGRNEDAIPLLKQALQLNPASSAAHLDLSASYIALKRYDEALTETTILLSVNPDDEKSYINYLAAAIGAGRMQDALRVGQDYLHRFPNGQNRTKLSNEMVAVEHELDRRANARGVMPPQGAPDNYLFYATPNGIRRWPPGTMPLRVYINNGNQCKGFVSDFQSVLINSFMTWQNATRGMIRFMPVDDLRSADIECRWTDSAANVSLAAEAGEAKVETVRNNIEHVTITLLTCRPESPSEKLTSNLLQQVCLHEIGHALGLDGHSDRAQDIMYCSTNPNVEHPNLTQRDINTLYLIYQ